MSRNLNLASTIKDSTKPHTIQSHTRGDFGLLVFYQGKSITFVSFGLIVGLGALLGFMHIWFYLGAYQVIDSPQQGTRLALAVAFGTPISAYIVTRLLDLKSYLSGEKNFIEYIRTVSFGLWGGLVGGLLIISSFALLTQTPLLALLDAFALGIPLAQVLGRLACLNYGCCHGRVCDSNTRFAVSYHNPQAKVLRYAPELKGIKLYPTQVYSAIANAIIYSLILTLALTWESRPQGVLVAIYMSLYGMKRFSVEYFRGEFPRIYILGLTVWQWFSLAFVVLGLGILGLVLSSGGPNPSVNIMQGLEGLKSTLSLLILASTIIAIAYGTHGRKIGSW